MQPSSIRTHALTHRFGQVLAVDRLELEVPTGSIYAFLGPNGAGKTTTIRAVLGLIRPTSGEVHLFGEPLAERRTSLLRRVGALVETPSLYPHLTALENLEVKRRFIGGSSNDIQQVLETVGLTQDARRLVRTYSLGMQQRLGLAKALLGQPELLILDEPTNGLDPAGIVEFRQLIQRLPAELGVTVFVSSHLLGEVEQVATYIGIIGQGRLLFQGTPAELHGRTRDSVLLRVDRTDHALRVLSQAGWTVAHGENSDIVVEVDAAEGAAEVNGLLVRAGLKVYELRQQRPSLEDLFLQLTSGVELGRRAA